MIYYDSDGNECSLDELCRFKPDWAASRVRAGRIEIERLRRDRDILQAAKDVLRDEADHHKDINTALRAEVERRGALLERWLSGERMFGRSRAGLEAATRAALSEEDNDE